MTAFKPISPDHPYKPWKYLHVTTASCTTLSKNFQPTDVEWPLYNIQLRRMEMGFSISVSLKQDLNSWWATCDYNEPIPFGILCYLTTMLTEFVA